MEICQPAILRQDEKLLRGKTFWEAGTAIYKVFSGSTKLAKLPNNKYSLTLTTNSFDFEEEITFGKMYDVYPSDSIQSFSWKGQKIHFFSFQKIGPFTNSIVTSI